MQARDVLVPGDVPWHKRHAYVRNFLRATKKTGRLMLFAGDQKVEHLNDDFFGEGIAADDADPKHLFEIASLAPVGVFATHMGLLARYGPSYPDVTYLVKLNGKSPLVKKDQRDPVSLSWCSVADVTAFRKSSGLAVAAVGYTIYLGSEYENKMFCEAARIVLDAHRRGLLVVLWIYPHAKAVPDEHDPHLIAGACGLGACLGADFVKVNYPKDVELPAERFKEAVRAAGRTGVICAGGSSMDERMFLSMLHDQIHISGARGNATGRNVHQRPLDEAVRFCSAVSAVTFEGKTVDEAMALFGEGQASQEPQ